MKYLKLSILSLSFLLGSVASMASQAESYTGTINSMNVGNDFLFVILTESGTGNTKLFGAWEDNSYNPAAITKNFDSIVTLLSGAYQSNSAVRINTSVVGSIWNVAPGHTI